MFGRRYVCVGTLVAFVSFVAVAAAQTPQRPAETPAGPAPQPPHNLDEPLRFAEESLAKKVDELMLFRRLEDLADVDRVRYTGPPPRVVKNPTGQGAGNPRKLPVCQSAVLRGSHPSKVARSNSDVQISNALLAKWPS